MSDYHIQREGLDLRPQFKSTTNLDMLRGERGEVSTPYVFDDGSLAEQKPETMKAFLDVSAATPLIKTRYTAAGFQQHQCRICCNNAYDPDVEPHNEGGQGHVSFSSFMKLIEVAFPVGTSLVERKAMLKRATWVVFGDRVYMRLAGETAEKPVPCFPYPPGPKDLLKSSCKERLSSYKEGEEWAPVVADQQWSLQFIRTWLGKKPDSIARVDFGYTPGLSAALQRGDIT
eukprot:6486038-Amphidinium_carterae.1